MQYSLCWVYAGQCPELSPLANGDITLSSPERLSGATATYTCDSGYELDLDTGSAMRTCQMNGEWEGSDRVCVRESYHYLTHHIIYSYSFFRSNLCY